MMTKLTHFLVFATGLLLSACSSDEAAYFKTFDHIKTDQFVWSYGDGGIYWVSENEVVLDAQVKNTQGIFEHGIYQVNVNDGSYIRLVERSNSYSYCFDGSTLFIKSSDKRKILHKPALYSIEQVTTFKKLKNGVNSALRCRSLEKPSEDGYRPLFYSDGFLKTEWSSSKYKDPDLKIQGHLDPNNKVVLVDNKGEEKKLLELNISQVSNPYFLADRNAYFGYRMRTRCASLWWLYRDGWETKTKKHCFGGWAQNTSKMILSTRVGLYVEHHTSRKYKTYLDSGGTEYKLETISARGGSLSPDGCRVAYGSGELSRQGGRRQVLKIFNACEFIK